MMPLSQQAQAASVVARVAAVVNGEAILSTEIEAEMDRVSGLTRRSAGVEMERGVLYDVVVDRLIEAKLQEQRIRTLGIVVDDSVVDRAISRILAQKGGISLVSHLNSLGLREDDFREGVREDILLNEAVLADNRSELGIDPNDVNHELRARLAGPDLREHLVEHALFSKLRRDHADEASGLPGDEFAAFALEYSISEEDMNLGWRTEQELPTAFAAEMESLRPGDVSRVMELGNGYHVIHLIATRPFVPGQSKRGQARLRFFSGAEGTTEEDLEDAAEAVRNGQFDFDEAAESLGGKAWVVERQISELPTSVTRGLRFHSGEIGGPFEFEGQLVIALVLGLETEIVGDVGLRERASVIAADINYLAVRRQWVEFLRSIATVEIVRADP